jgi:hypothetical protein
LLNRVGAFVIIEADQNLNRNAIVTKIGAPFDGDLPTTGPVRFAGEAPLTPSAQDDHKFEICQGYFALCAASTCTPTGNSIRVNVPSENTTRLFPEADCTCPIFSGNAIADVIGGNMKDSCEPPSPDGIWSLFSLMLQIPQEINGWVTSGPQALAPPLFCPAFLHLGDQQVNCFSFACDTQRYINGVPVATCHCALGESPAGKPVRPQTAFLSQAGQGILEFCRKHPVAGTISLQ